MSNRPAPPDQSIYRRALRPPLILFALFTLGVFASGFWHLSSISRPAGPIAILGDVIMALWIANPMIGAYVIALLHPQLLKRMAACSIVGTALSVWAYSPRTSAMVSSWPLCPITFGCRFS